MTPALLVAAVLPDCSARYYLTDQVDSVKVVTNDSGLVVTSHEYLPFGEDWITEGDTKNAPKYNSQELDKESGYYFYNARHYDPEIGRFVTPDTVIDGEYSTQGWNRFAYVHNNPIRYKDPTGHEAQPSGVDLTKGWNELSSKVSNALNDFKSSVTNKMDSIADNIRNNPQKVNSMCVIPDDTRSELNKIKDAIGDFSKKQAIGCFRRAENPKNPFPSFDRATGELFACMWGVTKITDSTMLLPTNVPNVSVGKMAKDLSETINEKSLKLITKIPKHDKLIEYGNNFRDAFTPLSSINGRSFISNVKDMSKFKYDQLWKALAGAVGYKAGEVVSDKIQDKITEKNIKQNIKDK